MEMIPPPAPINGQLQGDAMRAYRITHGPDCRTWFGLKKSYGKVGLGWREGKFGGGVRSRPRTFYRMRWCWVTCRLFGDDCRCVDGFHACDVFGLISTGPLSRRENRLRGSQMASTRLERKSARMASTPGVCGPKGVLKWASGLLPALSTTLTWLILTVI